LQFIPEYNLKSLGRLRQEDHRFIASLGYIVRLYLNKPTPSKKKKKEQKSDSE
jgi:hypothetical protein